MSVFIAAPLVHYTDGLRAVNRACNGYVSNQTPANAEAVNYAVGQFIETYFISRDEDIKPIVEQLQAVLDKDYGTSYNAEAQRVLDIRDYVDIIEPENLGLTLKE